MQKPLNGTYVMKFWSSLISFFKKIELYIFLSPLPLSPSHSTLAHPGLISVTVKNTLTKKQLREESVSLASSSWL